MLYSWLCAMTTLRASAGVNFGCNGNEGISRQGATPEEQPGEFGDVRREVLWTSARIRGRLGIQRRYLGAGGYC